MRFRGMVKQRIRHGHPRHDCGIGRRRTDADDVVIPELAIFGEARLRKFSYEFIHYEAILDAEEETDDEESAAAVNKG